ncbi:MAG: 30S ribosomal protein S20 [Thermodesulfobacteriota bacterium]
MDRHPSALKRARQNETRRKRNASVKTRMRKSIKKVNLAAQGGGLDQAKESLAKAIPDIARAASKGVLRKKTASRYISRLTRKVNALAKVDTPSPDSG